jgi:AcrR family transcriptional regulator
VDERLERGRVTRSQVVAVATRLFTERGYDGTSIEAVLQAAGISRGALYHHFPGKDALFAAVLDAVYERTFQQIAATTRTVTDPVAGLRAACLAWIRLTGDPDVARILLIDAPTVLGWQRWREMDEQRALGGIKQALAAAAPDTLARDHVDVFAHALLASMNEIAMMIARADEHAIPMDNLVNAVDELLRRLLTPTGTTA